MRLAVVTGFICLGLAASVPAQITAIQKVTPTPAQPLGPQERLLPATDARWTTRLTSQLYEACPGPLPGSPSGTRCTRHSLMVRNESSGPIQCKGVFEYAQANRAGELRAEADRVIFPLEEATILRRDVDGDVTPANYSAGCVAVPTGPLQAIETAPECKPALSGPPLEQFYPPAAKRREEQGAVVLEFTTTAATGPVKDVRVVASSGFVDLDNAALSFSKWLKVTSSCDAFRMRLKVYFRLLDELPAPEASL